MRLVDRSLSSFRWSAGWLVMFVLGAAASTLPGQERADDGGEKPAEVSLFDGQSLGDWKPTKFGGEGEVEVIDGQLVLHPGSPLTGVTWSGEAPSGEYELTLEAKKTRGIDFFCGLTFPVGDEHCSLIVGGWAGSLVGLSCLDGNDAAHNDTKRYLTFEKDRWYRIKVRVTEQAIAAWIDDEQVIDQPRGNIEFSVRGEVLLSRPLGLCTFETEGVYRNLTWRPIAGDSDDESHSDR
ncbi:MAG TPA: DUF1080 domain-containing protein [Pirellulaceae bacterium]|nr:DUF1080 domain-containing protein [Pirellulaceae bacterium]